MSKKNASAPEAQYVKKSSASVLAAVCLLAGVFIGFNVSLFMDAGGKKQTISVAGGAPMEQVAPVNFDFNTLIKNAEANPTQADGWTQLANAYFDTDNHGEAIKAYEKALAIDPKKADVWVDLGVMYRRHGEPQRAVECFTRASVEEPRHETARFNKGIVLLHDLNDRAGALTTWEILLKINPEAQTPTGKHLHDLVDEVRAGS